MTVKILTLPATVSHRRYLRDRRYRAGLVQPNHNVLETANEQYKCAKHGILTPAKQCRGENQRFKMMEAADGKATPDDPKLRHGHRPPPRQCSDGNRISWRGRN